jgi:hypothetical protein
MWCVDVFMFNSKRRGIVKKTLWKSLLLIGLSAFAINTYADWECSVQDAGGHRWVYPGMTQDHANDVAFSFCKAYSPQASSCHLTNCSFK